MKGAAAPIHFATRGEEVLHGRGEPAAAVLGRRNETTPVGPSWAERLDVSGRQGKIPEKEKKRSMGRQGILGWIDFGLR
jgi:hypothetical protein